MNRVISNAKDSSIGFTTPEDVIRVQIVMFFKMNLSMWITSQMNLQFLVNSHFEINAI